MSQYDSIILKVQKDKFRNNVEDVIFQQAFVTEDADSSFQLLSKHPWVFFSSGHINKDLVWTDIMNGIKPQNILL